MARKSMKQPQQQKKKAQPQSRGIQARIIDYQNGLRVLSSVQGVRIRSRDYVLLIMEDYLPAIGKIDGTVTFLTENGEETYTGISGFYKHQHNEFTLLIERRLPEGGEAAEHEEERA